MARPEVVVENPFVRTEGSDLSDYIDVTNEEVDIRVEDILVGVVRAFSAESSKRQELVQWQKVLQIYQCVDVLTRKNVQEFLGCSEAQAKRYMQVLHLATKLLKHCLKDNQTSRIRGYIHVSENQIAGGYIPSKERSNEGIQESHVTE